VNVNRTRHEATIAAQRRALDEVVPPAMATAAELDSYLFEPHGTSNPTSVGLRVEAQQKYQRMVSVMTTAPIVGHLYTKTSQMLVKDIVAAVPKIMGIYDDTMTPGKCQLSGDMIDGRVVEGLPTTLTIQAKDRNGVNIVRGQAPLTVTLTSTHLHDSRQAPISTTLKALDNNDGTYKVTWTSNFPGDYTVAVKLGQWTIVGGGVRTFRVHVTQQPIQGQASFTVGALGAAPGN
jgi:hypothetical protein